MHIHDFYSKLTSATEESRLFQALRTLSQVDNPKSITEDPVVTQTEWAAWPSLEANTASLAA
ncbi:MAG TPA: hypothetical protein VLR69_15620 [Thermoanaerobaculia bacterium]|nr:hypothetical protein [Thermoanaerobaculia bacterium]